jgi:cytochrome c553
MKITLARLALLGAGAAMAGMLFVWSGLFNVAASSGHWAITDWLLHYAMRRSVETHAMGIEVPPLDDRALARRAAGHYDSACKKCHGAPGFRRDPTLLAMTPPPPALARRIAQWQANELFWIVKHGVKFTAMPAWPAQSRDDEVWAMVAFLQTLPDLDAPAYRALIRGANEAQPQGQSDTTLATCANCHGEHGFGDGTGAFPRLDIQSEEYLLAALRAFASGARQSGIMATAVAGLGDETLQDLARHFASVPRRDATPQPAESGLAEAGGRIAETGIPAEKVPACRGCHDPGGAQRKPGYPALAGQYEGYIAGQLRLFEREAPRGGTDFARLMEIFAHRLSDADIDAVAAYYASVPASGVPDP